MRGKDERSVPLNSKFSEAGTMPYASSSPHHLTHMQISVECTATQIRSDPHSMFSKHPSTPPLRYVSQLKLCHLLLKILLFSYQSINSMNTSAMHYWQSECIPGLKQVFSIYCTDKEDDLWA